mmetsp:Transcript_122462/g.305793  ORF Transcript_122462/g.305793 Transcript_122462/m.305793 type:complete len:561 (-) Transcript_122462:392-2074(-)
MDFMRWFAKDEEVRSRGREPAAWVSQYAQIRDPAGPSNRSTPNNSTPSSTRASSPSGSVSPRCDHQTLQLSPNSLSSTRSLREYRSLGNRELWRWLWLDFSRPVQSTASKRLKRKLSNCNLEATAQEVQQRELRAIREEPVGLSLLPPIGEGSPLAGIFTLVSSAMGAGCLSLPFMFKQSGIILGLLLLFAGAVLAHLSLVVLMCCARYTDSGSMAHLVSLAGGSSRGGRAVDVVIAIYGIAAVLCYMMFIGDFFGGIVRSPFLGWDVPRETLIICIAAVVVWPLSLPRSLTALRYVCVLSVVSICITAVVVAFKTPEQQSLGFEEASGSGTQAPDDWELRWWNSDPRCALQSFSIAIFAFAAHTNAVPVATSLKRADGRSIWCVSFYSVCIEFIFYALMGLGGYLSFRGLTKQDFILNYSNDDLVIFVVRCVYGVVVCLGAPINLSPCASSILGLLSQGGERTRLQQLHPLVVTLVVVGCVCIAIWNEQVADVIGLIGSSCGTLIVLAWPSMIYRRVLFDLHPPRLAKGVYALLRCAALMGFAAFSVQAYSAWQGKLSA